MEGSADCELVMKGSSGGEWVMVTSMQVMEGSVGGECVMVVNGGELLMGNK